MRRNERSKTEFLGEAQALLFPIDWPEPFGLVMIEAMATPSILTSVPDHLPNRMRLPTLTSMGMSLPLSSRPPGPTAMTLPCCGFSWAVSAMMMPPAVFASASIRSMTTRSAVGILSASP